MCQGEISQPRQVKGKQEFAIGPVKNLQKASKKKKKKSIKHLPGPENMQKIYDRTRQVRTFLPSSLIFLHPVSTLEGSDIKINNRGEGGGCQRQENRDERL